MASSWQSIYSFRAATVRNILDFPDQFSPKAEIVTHRQQRPVATDTLTMKVREAADRAGTSPNARNEIFNITNGDYFRWRHMWPKIARMFRHGVGRPDPDAARDLHVRQGAALGHDGCQIRSWSDSL
jgi:hypothetical protein